jgi:myo-inositol 2-dehydrogenase / D-chiro-inositol 1-dehydrogenase
MGERQALHFYNLTPRANLIVVPLLDKKELVWANRNLEGVRTYESYGEMLRIENGLQAVVIAGVTTVHTEQAIKAIEIGLHVLCEKPLSTGVEIVTELSPATRLSCASAYLQSQSVCNAYRNFWKPTPTQK